MTQATHEVRKSQVQLFFLVGLAILLTIIPATMGFTNSPPRFSILHSSQATTRRRTFSALSTTTENDNNEVEKLRLKAAQIRAEIAAMEGKTVAEVEEEAKIKKDQERQRKEDDLKRKELDKNSPRKWDDGRFLEVPSTPEDMVRQAAQSVERAFKDGKTRQTVRFALVREDQYVSDENQWPGGAQQMYRESAKYLTTALLKKIYAPTKTDGDNVDIRLPPTIKEQDIWDFDGSALHTAEAAAGANGDVQALVLPNTDIKYVRDIETIDKAMGKRLFLLINPFWRNLDSWGINLLSPGAKKKAEEVIFNKGYDETYSLLRFSCRGEECVALKAYPYDWQLFAYREDENVVIGGQMMETAIRLGSSKEEPTSDMITELLNQRPEFKENKTMRQMRR